MPGKSNPKKIANNSLQDKLFHNGFNLDENAKVIFDAVSDHISLIDKDLNILWANKTEKNKS